MDDAEESIDDAINAHHRAAVRHDAQIERNRLAGGPVSENAEAHSGLIRARRYLERMIEAEVARRLAAAPDVEAAIRALDNEATAAGRIYANGCTSDCLAADEAVRQIVADLRAAIAADKARAVEAAEDAAFIRGRDAVRKCPDGWGLIARPTPDEARRLVDDAMQAAWGLNRPSGQSPDRREAARERAAAARTALLRALGVEA